MAPLVGYVAYLDEAGDDGLRRVRNAGSGGASQWLVLSAVVTKVERDSEISGWVKSIIQSLDQPQTTHLHFRSLKDDKRLSACNQLANLPIRIFVTMSHKMNMEGYTNLAAEQARVNKTAWFYCWMSRLLLERVSAYCGQRCLKDYGEPRSLRIEFSDRGGVKIDDIVAYYHYISEQSRLGIMFNKYFDLDWSVMDINQIISRPNNMRAGLQMSDIAASAFYQSVESDSRLGLNATYAEALAPRMARNRNGSVYGFGLKVMPRWIPSRLPQPQRRIFDFYEKAR